jgi:hypothetical protein
MKISLVQSLQTDLDLTALAPYKVQNIKQEVNFSHHKTYIHKYY